MTKIQKETIDYYLEYKNVFNSDVVRFSAKYGFNVSYAKTLVRYGKELINLV